MGCRTQAPSPELLSPSPGLPCKCFTRPVKWHGGTTTSLGEWRSSGPPTMRAASALSRAALMSGMPCRTWSPHGLTPQRCLWTSMCRGCLPMLLSTGSSQGHTAQHWALSGSHRSTLGPQGHTRPSQGHTAQHWVLKVTLGPLKVTLPCSPFTYSPFLNRFSIELLT